MTLSRWFSKHRNQRAFREIEPSYAVLMRDYNTMYIVLQLCQTFGEGLVLVSFRNVIAEGPALKG